MIQKNLQIDNIMENTAYHMLCTINGIENHDYLKNITKINDIMDIICLYNNIIIIEKINPEFSCSRLSTIYILEDFHMSVHTFPEKKSLTFEFCTFRNNIPFHSIFEFFVQAFYANTYSSGFNVINRNI